MKSLVLGGGGHAKVVVSTLQAAGTEPAAVYDDDSTKWGTELLGVPIAGALDDAAGAAGAAILAFGNNRLRRRFAARFELDWTSVIHPTAWVHSSVTLGQGSIVCAGAVIQPGARIGDHVIVNTAASIDHDCQVPSFCHVAPGARLAGGVRLGEGCLVGIGAAVLPGVIAGPWARIGAGAAVLGDVPAEATAVGVPAQILEASSGG